MHRLHVLQLDVEFEWFVVYLAVAVAKYSS